MSFWSSTLRRGRKDHRCKNCGRVAPKGELSYVEAGTVDGDFTSYRSCVPCHDLVERLYKAGLIDSGGYSEGYQFDELPDIAREAGEPWPPVPADTAIPLAESDTRRMEDMTFLRALVRDLGDNVTRLESAVGRVSARDSDRSGEAMETENTGSTEGESAGLEEASPK